MVDCDTRYCELLRTDVLKRLLLAVLAACNVCFLKTINFIEAQKYLFGINGLTQWVNV